MHFKGINIGEQIHTLKSNSKISIIYLRVIKLIQIYYTE